MRPKKHLSQYFLVKQAVLQRISDSIVIDSEDSILEIGSGRGELTNFLIGKSKSILCVEIDKRLCDVLEEKFKEASSVKIYCRDIGEFKLSQDNIVALGNIPYHLSFKILEFLIENRLRVKRAYLTLQKEFAKKLTGLPGTKSYGFLTCFVNLYSDVKILFNIPKTCFYPQPRVDSCLVEFKFYPKTKWCLSGQEFFISLIRKVFSQRRKKIVNILKKFYPEKEVEEILSSCRISPDLRPENISLTQFIDLANSLTLP